jgi:hypothetical protein
MQALFGGGLGVSTDAGETAGAHRSPELDWCACQCGMAIEDSEVVVPLTILLTKNSAGLLDDKPQPIK